MLNSMEKQNEINPSMRSVLVDWLIQVHSELQLCEASLYLSFSIIDRYIESCQIKKKTFQLVGITSLFISSKLNDCDFKISVQMCSEYIDFSHTTDEVINMENSILTTLQWRVLVPTPYDFLEIFSCMIKSNCRLHRVAKYYLEKSCLDYNILLNYKYSDVSLCCLILASYTVDAISSGFPPGSIQAEVDIDSFSFVLPECVPMSSNQVKKLCGVIYSSSCSRFISQKGELLRSIDEKYNMFYI